MVDRPLSDVTGKQSSLRVLEERYARGQDLAAAEVARVQAESGGDRVVMLQAERDQAIARRDAAATVYEIREALASGRALSLEECARYQLRLAVAMAAGMVAGR